MDTKDAIAELKLMLKFGLNGEFDGYRRVALQKAISVLEERVEYPEGSMNYISGEQPHLGWLILSAFRYSVGRHMTQSMWGIERVIIENLDKLSDECIENMLRSLDKEFSTDVSQGRSNTNYLLGLKKVLQDEYRSRGKEYESAILGDFEIDNVIVDNFRFMCDNFIRQMIGDMHRAIVLDDSKDKRISDYRFGWLLEQCQNEYEKRGHKRLESDEWY